MLMKCWTFKVFLDGNGDDVFEDWLEKQDVGAVAKIRARIDFLMITKTWIRPYSDVLHGTDHIREIIVKHNKRQYRPLGCYGPGPQVFTILMGTSKKEKRWDPHNAIETAEKRREMVFRDSGRYLGEYQPRARETDKESEE